MNDKTQNLSDARSFEERVFARFDAMDARFDSMETRFEARFDAVEARLTTLEDKVDARLRETRPIWESVQARLTTIEAALDEIRLQIIELHRDSLGLRSRIARLEDRERPPVA